MHACTPAIKQGSRKAFYLFNISAFLSRPPTLRACHCIQLKTARKIAWGLKLKLSAPRTIFLFSLFSEAVKTGSHVSLSRRDRNVQAQIILWHIVGLIFHSSAEQSQDLRRSRLSISVSSFLSARFFSPSPAVHSNYKARCSDIYRAHRLSSL